MALGQIARSWRNLSLSGWCSRVRRPNLITPQQCMGRFYQAGGLRIKSAIWAWIMLPSSVQALRDWRRLNFCCAMALRLISLRRARIGGRVITDRSLGFGADLGASWIHGSHANPVTEIAHALGLTLLRSDWEGVVTRNREGRSVDMPEWLLWHSIANLDYADDYDNLSDLALDEGEEFGGPDVMISGGYDQILAGFETDGVRLHLASPIVQITYGTGGVEIVTAAGSNSGTLTAQAAIVTLPLGVLQSGAVQFAPSLPPEVQASLSRLRMGSLEKVVLHYDHAFWDQGAEVILAADARDGAFAAFVNLLPLTGQAALMALNGGDYARSLAGLSTEVLGQRASAALAALYP